MLQLHWSESESDVARNGYLDSPVVCLHWIESDFAWKLGCNPFWSDVVINVSLSLIYNCTLTQDGLRENKGSSQQRRDYGVFIVFKFTSTRDIVVVFLEVAINLSGKTILLGNLR